MTAPAVRPAHIFVTAITLMLGLLAAHSQSITHPSIAVLLRPAAPDSMNHVPYVDVALTIDGPSVPANQPLLRIPIVTSNVETVACTLEQLSVRDVHGSLEVSYKDDAASAHEPNRVWASARATSGLVVVHYRVPISDVLAPRGAAPPLELRSDSGAFSGDGLTFLVLPVAQLAYKLSIGWDLSQMPAGAQAVSTLGPGDLTSKTASGVEGLATSFFMAGDIHLYPQQPPTSGFFAAWYGHPPFDARALMASEQKVYHYYETFFHRPSTAPYGVFLRQNLVNAGGGVELGKASFVATFGPKTERDELTITLAHEMLHTFVGGLDSPSGEQSSWYSEGLAVYYARLLALRAGQIAPAQFLVDLNTTAGRYYTDALIHTPNDQIAPNFWTDTRIRVLPYDRGSMYFAVVDGELRAASHGKTTLDDLLLAMLDRRHRGLPLDQSNWLNLIGENLGEKGRAEFEAMLSGATMVPQSQDFGPCFARTEKLLRRYQLGFEPRVLIEPTRIVRGLIPGSAAEKAGVRNGDEITRPVPQDLLQGQQDGVLTLELLRDGKPFEVSYVPRDGTAEAYQWVRTGSLPDGACAY